MASIGSPERHTVVGQHGMDPVGHSLDRHLPESCGRTFGGAAIAACEDQLEGTVDRDVQESLAALVAELGEIDIELANLAGLERLRLLAVRFGQAGDAMSLQAAVQRQACQMAGPNT
jgi:hypothetical protein